MLNNDKNALNAHIKRLGLQSSYLGVGKRLGKHIWLHKTGLQSITDLPYRDLILSLMDEKYCVVRLCSENLSFQLSLCPYFDHQTEPWILGHKSFEIIDDDAVLIKSSLAQTNNYLIYHHKHLMVSPHYTGFYLDKSVRWSEKWKAALPKSRHITSKIGRRQGWSAVLDEYLSP